MVSYESVNSYLDWLTYEKKAGFATKNNRLAAIRASISYASACRPEYISLAGEFSSIRIQKKERFAKIDYMTEATVEALLGQPDTKTKTGLRDQFLMIFLSILQISCSFKSSEPCPKPKQPHPLIFFTNPSCSKILYMRQKYRKRRATAHC